MINCTFENGAEDFLRHVTVVAITVRGDGKILLTRRAPHLLRGGKLTIPGGFMARNENFEQAAKREIKEETGLDAYDLLLFRINDNPERPKEDRQNVDVIFIAKVKETALRDNDEVSEFLWVDERDLPADSEFAFDHRDSLLKYMEYLKEKFELPIIG